MRHYSLPIGKAGHLRVGLPIKDFVQRMVVGFLLSIRFHHPIQMKRKLGDRFSQKPHAGVDRSNLHGGLLVHLLAAVGLTENKKRPGIPDVITHIRKIGSIPRIVKSEPVYKAHGLLSLLQICHLPVACRHAYTENGVAVFPVEDIVQGQIPDPLKKVPLLCHSHRQWFSPPSSNICAPCALPAFC